MTRDDLLYMAVALPVIAWVWLAVGHIETAAALTCWPARWNFLD